MNDRFRFRFWNKKENKYITEYERHDKEYGGELYLSSKGYIVNFYEEYAEEYYIDYDFNSADIIAEQCTGIKDKNGKLIYEGDIIKAFLPYGKETDTIKFPVCYKNGAFGNNFLNFFGPLANFSSRVKYEVLGNIHENPNLADEGYYYL